MPFNQDNPAHRDGVHVCCIQERACFEFTEGANDGFQGFYLALLCKQEPHRRPVEFRYALDYSDAVRLRDFLNKLELPEPERTDDKPTDG